MSEHLDRFGEFVVQNLRDKMLHDLEMLLSGSWKAPNAQGIQQWLANMSEADREQIRDLAEHLVTTGMHDLLFALQEQADTDGPICVTVGGVDVARQSDGMHGEIFSDDGWIARFSRYPKRTNG